MSDIFETTKRQVERKDPKYNKGQTITFKDGSEWTVKKIYDTSVVKDALYQSLVTDRYDYTLTSKHGTEIFAGESYISNNTILKTTQP